jgi:hypothetical protein
MMYKVELRGNASQSFPFRRSSWTPYHTTPASQPSIPPWFAETVLIAGYLRGHGFLDVLSSQVRLVRKRFGQYEVLDFLAVLFGYTISGERYHLPPAISGHNAF